MNEYLGGGESGYSPAASSVDTATIWTATAAATSSSCERTSNEGVAALAFVTRKATLELRRHHTTLLSLDIPGSGIWAMARSCSPETIDKRCEGGRHRVRRSAILVRLLLPIVNTRSSQEGPLRQIRFFLLRQGEYRIDDYVEERTYTCIAPVP